MPQLYKTEEVKENLILVAVSSSDRDNTDSSLDELEELVSTAGANTVARLIQKREKIHNVTYLGKGKIEELRELIEEKEASGIVCDDELSPVQMRNLEDLLGAKIIDRTMLILDIFAKRASTSEGKIQVELAQLKYSSARLVGLRNSLSRLGGGIGSKGPGEKKLELDRRLLHERIGVLKAELREVKKHREQNRKSREQKSKFVVAIVGYTNAGKSTLLNTLTGASALAEDKLFATLDPLTRKLELDSGQEILITDTVGFIRKLPHHLIEAFKSTLEEAKYADLILHIVDASNKESDEHMLVVYDTLKSLGAIDKDIITVYNKKDKCDKFSLHKDFHAIETIAISAKTKEGIDDLKFAIEKVIRSRKIYFEKTFEYKDAGKIQEIRKKGELLSEEYTDEGIEIKAYLPLEIYKKFI